MQDQHKYTPTTKAVQAVQQNILAVRMATLVEAVEAYDRDVEGLNYSHKSLKALVSAARALVRVGQ
jgi:hypothetical protein